MKHLFFGGFLSFLSLSLFAQEAPAESKTFFDETSLAQSLYDLEGNSTTVGDVFEKHKGKVIFLDLWASWCPDCIKGLPELEEVQAKFPEVVYLFFSLDRKESAWKKGIKKYNIQGEHYWFNTAWKNDFTEYIGLNWIPRYMLIDQKGNIAHFYAVHADDDAMMKAVRELSSVTNE